MVTVVWETCLKPGCTHPILTRSRRTFVFRFWQGEISGSIQHRRLFRGSSNFIVSVKPEYSCSWISALARFVCISSSCFARRNCSIRFLSCLFKSFFRRLALSRASSVVSRLSIMSPPAKEALTCWKWFFQSSHLESRNYCYRFKKKPWREPPEQYGIQIPGLSSQESSRAALELQALMVRQRNVYFMGHIR